MTIASASFTVDFGRTARTLDYRDAIGPVMFTFDVSADGRTFYLEHYGVRAIRPSNYDEAFVRTKQFLQARGYEVEDDGLARLPTPLTEQQAGALIRESAILPVPTALDLLESPMRATFQDEAGSDPWSLWIVAELKAGPHSGHKLVFDEHTRQFGVASSNCVFLGFWGSFRQTIEALGVR